MKKQRAPRNLPARIVWYLARHPEGVGTDQLYAWVRSCRKPAYTLIEFDLALFDARKNGASCANGLWYLRQPKLFWNDAN